MNKLLLYLILIIIGIFVFLLNDNIEGLDCDSPFKDRIGYNKQDVDTNCPSERICLSGICNWWNDESSGDPALCKLKNEASIPILLKPNNVLFKQTIPHLFNNDTKDRPIPSNSAEDGVNNLTSNTNYKIACDKGGPSPGGRYTKYKLNPRRRATPPVDITCDISSNIILRVHGVISWHKYIKVPKKLQLVTYNMYSMDNQYVEPSGGSAVLYNLIFTNNHEGVKKAFRESLCSVAGIKSVIDKISCQANILGKRFNTYISEEEDFNTVTLSSDYRETQDDGMLITDVISNPTMTDVSDVLQPYSPESATNRDLKSTGYNFIGPYGSNLEGLYFDNDIIINPRFTSVKMNDIEPEDSCLPHPGEGCIGPVGAVISSMCGTPCNSMKFKFKLDYEEQYRAMIHAFIVSNSVYIKKTELSDNIDKLKIFGTDDTVQIPIFCFSITLNTFFKNPTANTEGNNFRLRGGDYDSNDIRAIMTDIIHQIYKVIDPSSRNYTNVNNKHFYEELKQKLIIEGVKDTDINRYIIDHYMSDKPDFATDEPNPVFGTTQLCCPVMIHTAQLSVGNMNRNEPNNPFKTLWVPWGGPKNNKEYMSPHTIRPTPRRVDPLDVKTNYYQIDLHYILLFLKLFKQDGNKKFNLHLQPCLGCHPSYADQPGGILTKYRNEPMNYMWNYNKTDKDEPIGQDCVKYKCTDPYTDVTGSFKSELDSRGWKLVEPRTTNGPYYPRYRETEYNKKDPSNPKSNINIIERIQQRKGVEIECDPAKGYPKDTPKLKPLIKCKFNDASDLAKFDETEIPNADEHCTRFQALPIDPTTDTGVGGGDRGGGSSDLHQSLLINSCGVGEFNRGLQSW